MLWNCHRSSLPTFTDVFLIFILKVVSLLTKWEPTIVFFFIFLWTTTKTSNTCIKLDKFRNKQYIQRIYPESHPIGHLHFFKGCRNDINVFLFNSIFDKDIYSILLELNRSSIKYNLYFYQIIKVFQILKRKKMW